MRRTTAAAVSAAGACLALGMGVGGAGAASAAPAGGAETSSVFLTGTGRVIGSGDSARLDATIECPKGVVWSVAEGSTFGFAEIGDDDTFAVADANQSGRCNGKLQKVKVSITAYYNPPIPANCSAEYVVEFSFSDGSLVHVEKGAGGPSNGPEICLT